MAVVCAGRPAEAAADQIRTLGNARLCRKLGALTGAGAAMLGRLLNETYGE